MSSPPWSTGCRSPRPPARARRRRLTSERFSAFCNWAGHHHRDLSPVVPRTPHWRLAHLPPRLSWTEVRHTIDTIGRTTPIDVRDRAILLLLATTGIRNGELRALQLQDVDWRAGEVFIRHTKGKRDRVAPLLEETGAALADYILRARAKVDSAYLFLTFIAPVGPDQVRCAGVADRAEAFAVQRDRARSRRWCPSSAPQSGD